MEYTRLLVMRGWRHKRPQGKRDRNTVRLLVDGVAISEVRTKKRLLFLPFVELRRFITLLIMLYLTRAQWEMEIWKVCRVLV